MTTKFPSPFPRNIKVQFPSTEGEFKNENLPESQFAINLLTEINTPIQAIKNGTVFKIKNDSKKYGLNKKLQNQANYIVIDHGDETFAEYSHLSRKVPIRIGQKIKTEEPIGYTGLSGYMKTPHLYINLFKIEEGKPISLPFEIIKPKTQEDIAKIAGMILILSVGIAAFLLSRMTGNAIGEKTSSPLIIIPITLAVISGIIWILLKRKNKPNQPSQS